MSPTPARKRFRATSMVLSAALLVVGACSRGTDGAGSESSTSPSIAAPRVGPGGTETPTPAPSPEDALTALLAAEQKGDHAASYRLISAQARRTLDAPKWARRRSELAAITGFRLETAKNDTVSVVVQHEPGLDPFVGLRAGAERQTWRARRTGAGWLLDAEPSVKPMYPPRSQAPAAALAWARAVQACDQKAVTELEGVERLFGTAAGAGALCRSTVAPAVGGPEALPGGFASQELVAQYGPEAFTWAASVAINSGDRPFHVVLAPIGSVWKVVGVFEP